MAEVTVQPFFLTNKTKVNGEMGSSNATFCPLVTNYFSIFVILIKAAGGEDSSYCSDPVRH